MMGIIVLVVLAWILYEKPEKNEIQKPIYDPSIDCFIDDDELPDSEGLPGTKIQNN